MDIETTAYALRFFGLRKVHYVSPGNEAENIASVTTVIKRREAILADTIHCMLCYVRAPREGYGVRFVDVRITDIVEDMMFSNFLAANSTATYIRYLKVCKMIIFYQDMLSSLSKLFKDAPAAKPIVVIDCNNPSICMSSKADILLMIQASDAFLKNDHNPTAFHITFISRHARVIFDELYDHHY